MTSPWTGGLLTRESSRLPGLPVCRPWSTVEQPLLAYRCGTVCAFHPASLQCPGSSVWKLILSGSARVGSRACHAVKWVVDVQEFGGHRARDARGQDHVGERQRLCRN